MLSTVNPEPFYLDNPVGGSPLYLRDAQVLAASGNQKQAQVDGFSEFRAGFLVVSREGRNIGCRDHYEDHTRDYHRNACLLPTNHQYV